MKVKQDEENFDEAEAQAYRCWSEAKVCGTNFLLSFLHLIIIDFHAQIPSDISTLLGLPIPSHSTDPSIKQFYTLLSALKTFTSIQPPYTLPLSATLPDMHTSTQSYVNLQKLYKARAEEEKAVFRELLKEESGGEDIDAETVDSFLKNCHALKLLKGTKWGVLDAKREALGVSYYSLHSSSALLSISWTYEPLKICSDGAPDISERNRYPFGSIRTYRSPSHCFTYGGNTPCRSPEYYWARCRAS
jgi:amyloid beta precursor protein binding protein 1